GSFTITVTNQGPNWDFDRSALPTAFTNTNIYFKVPAAVDPEGEALTYELISAPTGLTFNAATRELTGVPTVFGDGQLVLLQARDPHNAVTQLSFTIDVKTQTPTWNSLPNDSVVVNQQAFT